MQKPFKKGGLRPLAFTLIELMLAIIIIAVLTTGFALTFQRATLKATFDDQVTQITAIIEKAGSYALSNLLVNDSEPAEYYYLYIMTSKITLSAVDADGASETLETFTFEDGFTMNAAAKIYYFPPDGTVCFSTDCSDTTTTKRVTFRDSDRTYQTRFAITKYGGYPEITEL